MKKIKILFNKRKNKEKCDYLTNIYILIDNYH